MRNWKRSAAMLALLAAMLSVHEASGQSTRQQTSSAQSSRSSGTGVERTAGTSAGEFEKGNGHVDPDSPAGSRRSVAACAAAVEELSATRRFVEVLERENGLLKERIDTEKQANSLLSALNESRIGENAALRNAVAAKNETIKAKDDVIAGQEKLIEALRKRKSSPWRRLGDVLIGVAAGAILR